MLGPDLPLGPDSLSVGPPVSSPDVPARIRVLFGGPTYKPKETVMRVKEVLKAPQKLADNTQAAVVISSIALVVAVLALMAATHRKGDS